jgi:hypothetical protein
MVHYHRFVDVEKGYRMLQLLRNKYLENRMACAQKKKIVGKMEMGE